MKQLIGNSGGVLLARVPRPALPRGWVLVRTRYSMVSAGTELAPLRAAFHHGAAPEDAERTERAKTALYYLGKAARNPKKAARKALEILRGQITELTAPAGVTPGQADSAQGAPGWSGRDESGDQGWSLGYSASGEVLACGEGVQELSTGRLVACCGAGWANHAEYMALPRNMVCPLPQGCPLDLAASATIGSIALQGVRRAAPALGERVAVIGLGLIGLLTVQLLKACGCKALGFDPQAGRVRKGLELGLDQGSCEAELFAALVKAATNGLGADKVIIAASCKSNAPLNQAMEIVRAKGTVVIVGDVGLAAERPHFYRKEINLLMSTSYGAGRYDPAYELEGRDYPPGYARWTIKRNMLAYMEQVAEGSLNPAALIERRVRLEEAPSAYAELAQSPESPLGVLLEYAGNCESAGLIEIGGAARPPEQKEAAGPVRAALSGIGAYGVSMIAPIITALPELYTLTGAVSADALRGGNWARQMRLPYFASSVEEMAARPDIDLLLIATRHNRHTDGVIAALERGKAVFVEKPLATTWEDLNRVARAYGGLERPPLLMIGFNRRFAPAVEALRAELSERKAPLTLLYRVNAGFIPPEHWVQTPEGGGRNIGEACHMYDLFRCLAGAPVEEISASAIMPENALRLRSDNFTAVLRYEDGSQGTLLYTACGPKGGLPKERLEVFCAGEAYILDDFKSLIRASDGVLLWSGETDKGHRRELELLGRALTAGGPSPIPFAEIMESSAVALRVDDLLHGREAD